MMSKRSLLLGSSVSLAATLAKAQSFSPYLVGRRTTGPLLQSLVGFAPANFNMLYWGKDAQATDFSQNYLLTGATISSGVVSPSGQSNAQKLVESSGSGNHRVYSFNAVLMATGSQCVFRVAVIAKAAERTRIVVFSETFGKESAISASVGFDLAGGNVGYDTAVGTQTTLDATAMTSLGGGYWLCTFDYHYTGILADVGSGVIQPKIYLDNGSGTASRSISYTGNGTSGVNLWWFSLMPKGAWSITSPVPDFAEEWDNLNSVDLSNTLDPSFKWFIRNYAPNSINPVWWAQAVLPPSLPGNFSIVDPSIIRFSSSGSNWQSMMYSVGFPNAGGYVGRVWQPPVLFDGLFRFDNSIHKTAAFWGHTVEPMAGTIAADAHWLEWDWLDAGATLSSVNDEYMSGGNPVVNNRSDASGWVGKNMTMSEFHRCSGLWLPMSSQGGVGTFMSFFDGQMVSYSDVAYSATENQPTTSDPNGVLLASFEAQHIPIMLDIQNTGPNSGGPMDIDWVRVYKP